MVVALAINQDTALKEYKELETTGRVAGRPGRGTFTSAFRDFHKRRGGPADHAGAAGGGTEGVA